MINRYLCLVESVLVTAGAGYGKTATLRRLFPPAGHHWADRDLVRQIAEGQPPPAQPAGRWLVIDDLPAVNATLNAASGVLLVIGYFLIRSGRIDQHRRVMIAAFGLSTLFLACYIVYHWQVGSVRFTRSGFVRPLYFSILFTHIVLAAAVPPLAIVSLWRGLAGKYFKHRAIARWTLPIWLYVSVTGVMVYLMLYHLWPSSEIG